VLYGGDVVGWIEGPAKTIDAVGKEMASVSDDQVLTALAAF
jgi:hypothetical protein